MGYKGFFGREIGRPWYVPTLPFHFIVYMVWVNLLKVLDISALGVDPR